MNIILKKKIFSDICFWALGLVLAPGMRRGSSFQSFRLKKPELSAARSSPPGRPDKKLFEVFLIRKIIEISIAFQHPEIYRYQLVVLKIAVQARAVKADALFAPLVHFRVA